MPLAWNEIRDRALAFSREWKDAASERAEAQSFWNAFFGVFGIERRRVAVFEKQVALAGAGARLKTGRIDAFWKGVLLIEHKSAGGDLERAFAQAADYFEALPARDLPRYILVSDFQRFRLFDLEAGADWQFALADLHKHVRRFGFVAGYRTQEVREQDPVNVEAAERLGKLHDLLKASGYGGHPLEVFLVRLLFCLFADDTGIFNRQSFREFIEEKTAEDGSDLGPHLAQLFQVLNTPLERRQSTLDEALAAFPYVNGQLFAEALPLASFDRRMRSTLLDCAALDWSGVSPAIFGAMFQSVMDEKARRNLGAHYTSEKNILKLIKPLFLDGLWEEFKRVRGNLNRLFDFHKRLRTLVFLDPACGCGNFLVIAYRELRLLELEILRAVLAMERGQQHLNIFGLVQVNVDQFHGIEIEEFPAQIAQVALWLVDHQMNQRISEEFGQYYARLPLVTSPHIVNGNALRLDWNGVVPKERLSYILGNPPFVGAMVMSDSQRADMALVFEDLRGYGVLDYVSCWYWKAAKYIQGTSIAAALVSTNSITQGEQVGLLWAPLMQRFGLHIQFAHRTFRWSNEARGVAAVHCVIVGFACAPAASPVIYEYDTVDGEPHLIKARNINAYLVDAPDVFLTNRKAPVCNVPAMRFGSMPRDGGHLVLSERERDELLAAEPGSAGIVRPYTGADEFLNGYRRYCLWLTGARPDDLRRLPKVMARVEKVRQFRLNSKAASTRRFANTPAMFCQLAQPEHDYLLVPRVSSERRRYLPIGFMSREVIANDQVMTVEGATTYHFGVVSSKMHMAWVRYTCGRLESRYRYSKDIVYNNFPWPESPTNERIQAIEAAAQAVLDARAKFPDASLADLYDPLTMPPDLVRAHQALDRAVDAAYGKKDFKSDAERVAFLFELYQRYTSLLPAAPAKRVRTKRKSN